MLLLAYHVVQLFLQHCQDHQATKYKNKWNVRRYCWWPNNQLNFLDKHFTLLIQSIWWANDVKKIGQDRPWMPYPWIKSHWRLPKHLPIQGWHRNGSMDQGATERSRQAHRHDRFWMHERPHECAVSLFITYWRIQFNSITKHSRTVLNSS
jgi:hypothetical protein